MKQICVEEKLAMLTASEEVDINSRALRGRKLFLCWRFEFPMAPGCQWAIFLAGFDQQLTSGRDQGLAGGGGSRGRRYLLCGWAMGGGPGAGYLSPPNEAHRRCSLV